MGKINHLQNYMCKRSPTPQAATGSAPPLIIRQQPAKAGTPEPLVIRETPPQPPMQAGPKRITISGNWNVIVLWEAPEVNIRQEMKDLGVIRINPVLKYAFKSLNQFVKKSMTKLFDILLFLMNKFLKILQENE